MPSWGILYNFYTEADVGRPAWQEDHTWKMDGERRTMWEGRLGDSQIVQVSKNLTAQQTGVYSDQGRA